MATNINEPWGECEILSSRKLSDEEVHELQWGNVPQYSLADDIRSSIETMNKSGYNITLKDELVTCDFKTLVELIETYLDI